MSSGRHKLAHILLYDTKLAHILLHKVYMKSLSISTHDIYRVYFQQFKANVPSGIVGVESCKALEFCVCLLVPSLAAVDSTRPIARMFYPARSAKMWSVEIDETPGSSSFKRLL